MPYPLYANVVSAFRNRLRFMMKVRDLLRDWRLKDVRLAFISMYIFLKTKSPRTPGGNDSTVLLWIQSSLCSFGPSVLKALVNSAVELAFPQLMPSMSHVQGRKSAASGHERAWATAMIPEQQRAAARSKQPAGRHCSRHHYLQFIITDFIMNQPQCLVEDSSKTLTLQLHEAEGFIDILCQQRTALIVENSLLR